MLYVAYNSALSATTNIAAGTSYATGAKVALQLQVPDSGYIKLVEWGVHLDVAQSTAALVEIASTDTASTVTTAHTTTTVQPYLTKSGPASRLTMGTTGTGYGNGTITSNTTLRMADRAYVTQSFVKLWPMGLGPMFGDTTTENYVQFRINTAATVNAICYLVWEEDI